MTYNANREKVESVLKMSGIKDAPVDLDKVAHALGFSIIQFPFPDKRAGMVLIEEGNKAIGVNFKHSVARQRFTIAHELGHYLNGHEHQDNQFLKDEDRYFDQYFQQEKEADAFAAELLMPKNFLERDLAQIGLDVDKLKSKYQVSEQAMWIRLTSLRLVEKYKPL